MLPRPVSQSFTVAKASQTISFGALADKTYGDSPFAVSASASSGLPVSFSVQSGPATINGSTVTITGAGMVTVRAAQAGNTNYNAAPSGGPKFHRHQFAGNRDHHKQRERADNNRLCRDSRL